MYPWLLRLAFSNFVFGTNSVLLFCGLTEFRHTHFVLEPSWTCVHHCIMGFDMITRFWCAYHLFCCFLVNLRNDTSLIQRTGRIIRAFSHPVRALFQRHDEVDAGRNEDRIDVPVHPERDPQEEPPLHVNPLPAVGDEQRMAEEPRVRMDMLPAAVGHEHEPQRMPEEPSYVFYYLSQEQHDQFDSAYIDSIFITSKPIVFPYSDLISSPELICHTLHLPRHTGADDVVVCSNIRRVILTGNSNSSLVCGELNLGTTAPDPMVHGMYNNIIT